MKSSSHETPREHLQPSKLRRYSVIGPACVAWRPAKTTTNTMGACWHAKSARIPSVSRGRVGHRVQFGMLPERPMDRRTDHKPHRYLEALQMEALYAGGGIRRLLLAPGRDSKQSLQDGRVGVPNGVCAPVRDVIPVPMSIIDPLLPRLRSGEVPFNPGKGNVVGSPRHSRQCCQRRHRSDEGTFANLATFPERIKRTARA